MATKKRRKLEKKSFKMIFSLVFSGKIRYNTKIGNGNSRRSNQAGEGL
jgi:hypothetical protein